MSASRHPVRRFFAGAILLITLALPATATLAQTTFNNTSVMLLPHAASTGAQDNFSPGEPASLYPSTITVSGMGSSITKLTVTIKDFRHALPDDIDMMLVGPGGQKFVFWSDVGGVSSTCSANDDSQLLNCNNETAPGTVGPTITLDDAGATLLPDANLLTSGTFKPTNVGSASDNFPTGTPAGTTLNAAPEGAATFASVFNGTNPNGTWRLYVIDDSWSGTGRINGGWSITITTSGGTSPTPTTTIVTGDTPDPSNVNQGVLVSFTVGATSGTPSGSVTVSDTVSNCTGILSGGQGQCTIALTNPGTRTLTATYAGSGTHSGSSGATSHVVRYNTTTAITADTPDPSVIAQSITVSYTVVPTASGGPAPGGNVTVSDGVNNCVGPVGAGGAGSCSIALLTPGARTLAATYGGDNSNNGSTSANVSHQVSGPLVTTTTIITSDTPDPSDIGQAVVVTWTVTSAGPAPTGTVTVGEGFNSCQAAVGAGQCSISSLPAGDRMLTATYSGDSVSASSSGAASHRVRYNTTTTITNDTPDPSTNTQSVTITYAVAATVAGGPAPTGNVAVSDGVSSCSGTAAAGSCAMIITTGGARTLVATYAGDGFNKASSTSVGTPHTVAVPVPNLTIAKSHQGIFVAGQIGAAYTITVSNVGTAATAGLVTVTDTLPAGLAAAAISGLGWTCTQPSGPCTRSDALAAGASYPSVALLVNVALTAPPSVTNVASVSGGNDSNTGDNLASDVTQIGGGGTLYTLTITRNGSGTGTVASQDGGINCGATCSTTYLAGTVVTLNASSGGGSTFNGWSACVGTAACTITMNANKTISGTFALSTNGTRYLDIDNNRLYDALTDSLLITRYLFGTTGNALTAGAIGGSAQRSLPAAVLSYLDDIRPRLDIDGNGQLDPLTDGVIVMRYMFGSRGAALTGGAIGSGATRTAQEIESYMSTLTPP